MELQLKMPGFTKYRFVSDHAVFWTGYFPLTIRNFKNINNPKQI